MKNKSIKNIRQEFKAQGVFYTPKALAERLKSYIIDIWLAENPKRKIETMQFSDGTWCNTLIPAPDETGTEAEA